MTARVIPLVAAGTYYANKSPAAGPNASRMQGLVWHAKLNRTPPLSSTWHLEHPAHPVSVVPISCAIDAWEYSAELLYRIGAIGALRPASRVALVPIPASGTTRATAETGRWPARELARRLEARGLGRLSMSLVQQRETRERKGERGKTQELYENLEILVPPAPDEVVVFVDDVVTWGEHLAAADATLRCVARGAVAIGATHAKTRNAYDVLYSTVTWDWTRDAGWSVDVKHPDPVPA